jgi:exonuclease VII small subunit
MRKLETEVLELGQAKSEYERGVVAGRLLEKLAQVEKIIDRIEAKLDKIEERHGNYSRDSSTSNEEPENNL